MATAACGAPPQSLADAGPDLPDAARIDAWIPPADAAIDAPILDAGPKDAMPGDASLPDAMPPTDAYGSNPLGIAFTDITDTLPQTYAGGAANPDPWGLGSGVALGDVDGDGDLDIVLARCDTPMLAVPGGPSTVLLRTGAAPLAYVEDTSFAVQTAGLCAHGVALGDFDADGDLDLFLAADGPDRLYQNNGAGVFTDVTGISGVAGPAGDLSAGAVWADVNADGLLDLYVLALTPTMMMDSHPLNANRLYLNRGDGAFEDVSAVSGAGGDGSSWTALIADLDRDGALEIYVVNDQFVVDEFPPTTSIDPDAWLDRVFLDDQGVPSFVDLTASKGTDGPRSGMGAALVDADGDGWDDILVTNWGTNIFQVYEPTSDSYVHQQVPWNLAMPRTPEGYRFISWGARFVDLDRDGSSEVVIVNGSLFGPVNCTAVAQMDLFLRRHPGNDVFDNITPLVGLPWHHDCNVSVPDLPYSGRGVAVGDLDSDGDDDLVVTPFGEKYRVYRNDTPPLRHHVRAHLRGTVSSPHPAGAVLEVTRLDGKVIRRVLYAGGETQTQSPRVLEVGLDTAASVASAWIRWPSGFDQRVDTLPSFAVDTELELVEPAWLTLSTRVAASADPPPTLTYRALASDGGPLGAAGEGRTVIVTRSDGVTAAVAELGGGVYEASLPHPGSARVTVLTVEVDGVEQRPRLTVRYR